MKARFTSDVSRRCCWRGECAGGGITVEHNSSDISFDLELAENDHLASRWMTRLTARRPEPVARLGVSVSHRDGLP